MKTIGEIGEKRLIAEFIRPFFNEDDAPEGVGDDCAMVATDGGTVLLSTDRVPADLISFRLGILGYEGLGRYLAVLNVSDVAACGGTPKAMLLNFGLPGTFAYENLVSLCRGVRTISEKFKCPVLGGDLSSASEMSISATVMGIVKNQNVLTRRAARPGDTIFVSRSIGLTPAAFAYHFRCLPTALTPEEIGEINGQFMNLEPMVELGQKLAASGVCSSCMDNTDGLGQTLIELAENSRVGFHIQKTKLRIDELVTKVAESARLEVTTLALSAGADFSLVGTLRGLWSEDEASEKLGLTVQFIGSVVDGEGAWLCSQSDRERITSEGWNYFAPSGIPFGEKTDE